MSYIEFLLEYYIWIIAVIILLVVGIIGYLVDSNQKSSNKKDKLVEQENNKETMIENQSINNEVANMQLNSIETNKFSPFRHNNYCYL